MSLLVFSAHWNHEEVDSNIREEIPQYRINELVKKGESKQAKSKSYLLPCTFM